MNEPTDRVATCLSALLETSLLRGSGGKGSVDNMIEYYRRRATSKRRAYRLASVCVMALGASLPAVAAFGHDFTTHKDLLLSILSAGIAFLTGLLSHFRWEVGWRSQTEALFALKAEKSAWEAAIITAKLSTDQDEAVRWLTQAFEHFRIRTFEIAREERGKFFKAAQPLGVEAATTRRKQ